MSNEDICRLCLTVTSFVSSIFKDDFVEIIENLISMKVSKDDGLPENMCNKCECQLISVKSFRKCSLDSFDKLTAVIKTEGSYKLLIKTNQKNHPFQINTCGSSESVKTKANIESSDDNSQITEEGLIKENEENGKLCNISFMIRNKLTVHKLGHNKSLPSRSLGNSSKTHSLMSQDCCEDCPKVEDIFYKKNSNRPFLYHCTLCNIEIKGEKELRRHKSKHCKINCKICKILIRSDHLKKHMENIHLTESNSLAKADNLENQSCVPDELNQNDKSIKISNKKTGAKIMNKLSKTSTKKTCKSKVYNNSDGIIVVVNDTIPYKYHCNICNVDFDGQKLFNYHKNKHVKKTCKVCGVSVTYGNYSNHIRNHVAGQQVCDVCGAVLASFESLRSHIFRLHNDKKKLYSCEECNITFRYRKNLTLHSMKVHTGFRPHVCENCGKRFFTLRLLKKHINTVHLKLRNNICEYCKKGFSSPYALKVHTRQHTNETPYICGICSERFRQPVSLRTHMKSKHGIDVSKGKDKSSVSQSESTIEVTVY